MKPRARRVTIGVAGLGAVLVAVLTVACWDTVRDHLEAWHFQLTRETEIILRDPGRLEEISTAQSSDALLEIAALPEWLADCSGTPVIADPERWAVIEPYATSIPEPTIKTVFKALKENGYLILEQRFPRRAYVVIRAAETIPDPPFFETLVIPGQPAVPARGAVAE